jgi:hypothetical protein
LVGALEGDLLGVVVGFFVGVWVVMPSATDALTIIPEICKSVVDDPCSTNSVAKVSAKVALRTIAVKLSAPLTLSTFTSAETKSPDDSLRMLLSRAVNDTKEMSIPSVLAKACVKAILFASNDSRDTSINSKVIVRDTAYEGAKVGVAVGTSVGAVVGAAVGEAVGEVVGEAVGETVGEVVGPAVGACVGAAVGFDPANTTPHWSRHSYFAIDISYAEHSAAQVS